jgi:cardiolipin synthase (CMP-forming)
VTPYPWPVDREGRRILTIPNVISVIRLLLVPVFLWLLWKPDPARRGAAALLAFLGATDWIDGYIARHWNQGSELGKILDPTADRVLLVAAAIALLVEDISTGVNIVLWIVIVREVLIAVVTIALAMAGARRIDVVWAGKAGTLAIMFALPMFLIADAAPSVHTLFNVLGWGFAIGGIVLGYFAVVQYIPAARAALKEGRATRSSAEVPA